MKQIISFIAITFCLFTLIGCSISSQSTGTKAAEEVISCIESGNMERAKELLQNYGDTLEGQDFLDFCEALEKEGIFYP